MKLLLPSEKVFAAAKVCIADIEADRKAKTTAIVAAEMQQKRLKWRARWPFLVWCFHVTEEEAIKFLSWPGSPYLEAKSEWWAQHQAVGLIRDAAAAMIQSIPGALIELDGDDFRWLRNSYPKAAS